MLSVWIRQFPERSQYPAPDASQIFAEASLMYGAMMTQYSCPSEWLTASFTELGTARLRQITCVRTLPFPRSFRITVKSCSDWSVIFISSTTGTRPRSSFRTETDSVIMPFTVITPFNHLLKLIIPVKPKDFKSCFTVFAGFNAGLKHL